MFRSIAAAREARRHRRKLRAIPRDLSPHMMRDLGLEPWPEREPIRWRQLW